MLNNFCEPQKAVLSIQQDLDGDGPKAALFIDMAKAFEKVNPHWAIDVCLREDALCGLYNMPCTCSLEDASSTKSEGNCFHRESYGKA